jgi:2-polyprenyl-3-methyl-5-hydroxy-6-metoxy-1,4-benzoquinol methylase
MFSSSHPSTTLCNVDKASQIMRKSEMIERSEWLKQMREKTETIYDLWATMYFFETDENAAKARVEAHVRYLEEFIQRMPPRSNVLSAGCGAGRYDGMLLDAGHSVVGIDLSERLLVHARKLYPTIRYEHMALQEMSFQNEFDGAICIEALEHVFPEEWPVILHGFWEALKSRGVLYFTLDTSESDVSLNESYEQAKARGLPVVLGEVADEVDIAFEKVIAAQGDVPDEVSDKAVYHYYPGVEQVRTWLDKEKFAIEAQGAGTFAWGSDNAFEATYEHFVVRKR